MAIRIRKNVWKLTPLSASDAWHPDLLGYAIAIADMQTRPITDPTSWTYQAAIHGFDPDAHAGQTLPSQSHQDRFWNQCQHASWFFLPWHRMYLAVFEQIIAAAVERLTGVDDWALPYWNYSDTTNPNARKLPQAFRLPTLPNGNTNPLFISDRTRGNDGNIVATPNQVDIRTCLTDARFEAPSVGGTAGFGGPQTGFRHSGGFGSPIGKLENTPHNTVHGAVGGFMGAFDTAGLDPLFWLHHANIDRLWVVWRNRESLHVDPTKQQWLSGVTFNIHDAQGTQITFTASQMVDTTVPLLNYEYDDVADPIGGTAAAAPPAVRRDTMAEMVGASEEPIVLTGDAASTRITVSEPTGPAAAAAAPEAHLNIENVTGLESEGTYAVYLNMPDDTPLGSRQEWFAGLVPLFGVPEATRGANSHPGDGLTFSLDVTDLVVRLQTRGEWTGELRVTFVPEEMPIADDRRAAAAPSPITVGRVSLYYA